LSTSEQERLRVMIAGGGTGGHLFPALAVAEAVQKLAPGTRILFVGSDRGLEARRFPRERYELALLPVRGLSRRNPLANVVVLGRFLSSLWKAWKLVGRFDPHVVLGVGGYSSGPACSVALLRRRPLALHEQNSYPGLVTRRLSRWAKEVYLSYEQAAEFLSKKARWLVTGNPPRAGLKRVPKKDARQFFGLPVDVPVVFAFGGSQGARGINEALLDALPELLTDTTTHFLWAVGRYDLDRVKEALAKLDPEGKRVRAFEFVENMAEAYSAADLVICRAGATTLSELTALGVPALLVPYPYAAGDHQRANARALAEAGAAVVVDQSELSGERLAREIRSLLANEQRLQKMAEAARSLARPRAALDIAERLLRLARERAAEQS